MAHDRGDVALTGDLGQEAAEGARLPALEAPPEPEPAVDRLAVAVQEAVGAGELPEHDMVVAVVAVEGPEAGRQAGEHVGGGDAQGIQSGLAAGVQQAVVAVGEQLQARLAAEGGGEAGFGVCGLLLEGGDERVEFGQGLPGPGGLAPDRAQVGREPVGESPEGGGGAGVAGTGLEVGEGVAHLGGQAVSAFPQLSGALLGHLEPVLLAFAPQAVEHQPDGLLQAHIGIGAQHGHLQGPVLRVGGPHHDAAQPRVARPGRLLALEAVVPQVAGMVAGALPGEDHRADTLLPGAARVALLPGRHVVAGRHEARELVQAVDAAVQHEGASPTPFGDEQPVERLHGHEEPFAQVVVRLLKPNRTADSPLFPRDPPRLGRSACHQG
jgi:hypothetical protein